MIVKRVPNWDGTKESTELYHHGIKGQKWGIRRYQNPDGSLTAEGQKRYGTTNKYLSAKDVDDISEKNDTKRAVVGIGGFATAGGLLAASSVAAPPFTLPLAVGAAALEIGVFGVDAALKKSGEKKLSEAKPLLNEAQSYIYSKIESAKKSSDFQTAYNYRNLSDTISKGENAGKVYSVHEHKDGGASFVSQEYRDLVRKHKKSKK